MMVFHPHYSVLLIVGNGQVAKGWQVLDDHAFATNMLFYKMNLHHEDSTENDVNGTRSITLATLYEQMKPVHGAVVIDYLKFDIWEEGDWKVNYSIIRRLVKKIQPTRT